MNLSSPPARRFFKLRLLASVVSFAGFCLCAGKAWHPLTAPAGFARSDAPPTVEIHPVPGNSGGDPVQGTPSEAGALTSATGAPAAVTASPPAAAAVLAPTLVIDAGHGGTDGGTVRGTMIEKEWTLKVALSLAEELRNRGHSVELIRTADDYLPVVERSALVNAFPRTAMISIHFNADSSDASGVETWYSWPKRPEVMTQLHATAGLPEDAALPDEGMALAKAIQSAVHEKTDARDRGIKNRTDLALTSRCLCPAVLVECGFISNTEEAKLIRESSYRLKIVRGIADGYEAWLLSRPGGSAATNTPAAGVEHRDQPVSGDAGAEH